MADYDADVKAIEKVVEDLFATLCWEEDTPPAWDKFRALTRPETVLYPSARPMSPTALEPFIAMMQGQRENGGLRTFDEGVTGHQVMVFGNFAVCLSGYTQQANGGDVGRGVNGFLFIKDEDGWKIGAMCWDKVSAAHPLPPELGGK